MQLLKIGEKSEAIQTVAIKNMNEIPKTCCDEDKLCPLFNEETGTCNGVDEFIMTDTTMKRFPNCPLVEIEERKLEKIKQIVAKWNNDASHSFEDMCKINGIVKQE